MEIVIDPTQLWNQLIAFANEYKLLTSLLLLIVLHFIKRYAVADKAHQLSARGR